MPIPRFVLDDGDREGRPGGSHALKRSRPSEAPVSPDACAVGVGSLLKTCRKFGVDSRGPCRAWGLPSGQSKVAGANESHNLLKSDARIPEPQESFASTVDLFSPGPETFGEDFELGPPPPCPPSLCRQKAMDFSAGCPLKQAALSLAKKYSTLRRHQTPASMVAPPTACFARLSLSRDRKRPTDT